MVLLPAVIALMFVDSAIANPILYGELPAQPDTNPPIITIHTPISNKTHYSQNLILNFTVSKPNTWFKLAPAYDSAGNQATLVSGNITKICFEIDGAKNSLPIHDMTFLAEVNPKRTLNFSTNLSMPTGRHEIMINVVWDSFSAGLVKYYYPSGEPYYGAPKKTSNASSEVIVFIEKETVTEVLEATPTAQATPLVIVPTVAITVAFTTTLYYFKRRKH